MNYTLKLTLTQLRLQFEGGHAKRWLNLWGINDNGVIQGHPTFTPHTLLLSYVTPTPSTGAVCLFSSHAYVSFSWLLPTDHRHTIRWIRASKFPTGTNGSVSACAHATACVRACMRVCVYLSICVRSAIDRQPVQGFPCLLHSSLPTH